MQLLQTSLGPFNTTFLNKNLFLSTHFLALGSMLSWKICEENILECWKRLRKKRYLFVFICFVFASASSN